MTRRLGLLLLLTCVLAGGALWLVSLVEGARIGAVAGDASEPSLSGRLSEPSSAHDTVAQDPRTVPAEMWNDDERAKRAEVVGAAPRRTIDVLVVDGTTQQPVQGASVWVLASTAETYRGMPALVRQRMEADREGWVREHSEAVRTDRDGTAPVPMPETGVLHVMARADERFGEIWIASDRPAPTDGYRIELEADLELRFRVVGPSGEPVEGARLLLEFPRRVDARLGVTAHHRVEPAGADGRCCVRHAQQVFRGLLPSAAGQKQVRVLLESPGFARKPVGAFAVEPWPEHELEVRVPTGGTLEVSLCGAPAAAMRTAVLWLAEAKDRTAEGTRHFGLNRDAIRQPFDEAGIARFGNLALGESFAVAVHGRESMGRMVEGPRVAGEVVRHVLDFGEELPRLCFRLLDERGEPMREQLVEVYTAFQGVWGSLRTKTDRSGRASAECWHHSRKLELASIEFRVALQPALPKLRHRVDIGRVLSPGANELGDVRVMTPPLLAEGVVRGLEPSTLRGSAFHAEASSRDSGGRETWQGVLNLTTVWGEEGRFRVHGSSDAEIIRLRLLGDGVPGREPVPIRRGASGVLLAFERPATIELPIRWPEDPLLVPVRGELRAAGGQLLPEGVDSVQERLMGTSGERVMWFQPRKAMVGQPDSEFPTRLRWHGLAPGDYVIELLQDAQPAPVAVRTARVAAGETLCLPPVELIHPREIRVELQDASGRRLGTEDEAVVLIKSPTQNAAWRGVRITDGVAVLSLHQPADLVVYTAGRPPHEVRAVFRDQVVRLPEGRRLSVQLAFDPAFAGSRAWLVQLSFADVAADMGRFETASGSGVRASLVSPRPPGSMPLPADGRLSWEVPVPGEYRLELISTHDAREVSRKPVLDPAVIHVGTDPIHEVSVRAR